MSAVSAVSGREVRGVLSDRDRSECQTGSEAVTELSQLVIPQIIFSEILTVIIITSLLLAEVRSDNISVVGGRGVERLSDCHMTKYSRLIQSSPSSLPP